MPTFQRPTRLLFSKFPLRVVSYRSVGPKASPPLPSITPTVKRRVTRLQQTPPPIESIARIPQATAQIDPDTLSLTLPVPPSINHQYATVNGRRLLSSEGRAYKAQVAQLIWLCLAQSAHRATLLSRLKSESLVLTVQFYFTSALRRDVDGGLKIAQDALCEGLELNDNRIVETHLYKRVDKTNPRIEVRLTTTTRS